ncbi:MAG: hypothetical protein AB1450_06310 [Pseudomonadota bacterium]
MAKKPASQALLGRSRNLLHDHPLLKKGAAHGKSRKAERRSDKVKQRREWDYPSLSAAA